MELWAGFFKSFAVEEINSIGLVVTNSSFYHSICCRIVKSFIAHAKLESSSRHLLVQLSQDKVHLVIYVSLLISHVIEVISHR